MDWFHYNPIPTNTLTDPPTVAYNFDFIKELLETKAFASMGTDINIMIINHSVNTQTFALKLDGNDSFSSTVPSTAKKFVFDVFPSNSNYVTEWYFGNSNTDHASGNGAIEGQSTVILTFACNGVLRQRLKYGLNEASNSSAGFYTVTANSAPIVIQTYTTLNTSVNPANCVGAQGTGISLDHHSGATYQLYKMPSTQVQTSVNSDGSKSNVQQGLYRTIVTGGAVCPNVQVQVATVVHQNSPLIDPGDKNLSCASSHTIGNSHLPVNSSNYNVSYSWLPSGYPSGNPLTVDNLNTTVPTNFTMTATKDGCSLSDQVYVPVGDQPDLVIRDTPNDIGLEPNTLSSTLADSQDMWNRNSNDQGTTSQWPVFNTPNYFMVQIHNMGCGASGTSGKLSLYHTKATTVGTWTTQWNNYDCSNLYSTCGNEVCGGALANQISLPSIAAQSSIIESIQYTPQLHSCIPGSLSQQALSFLAHVDHDNDPLQPLFSSPYDQALNYNNVAWKNHQYLQSGIIAYHRDFALGNS
jgi:hypothetical protein